MAPKEGTRAFLRFDSPSRGRVLEPGVVEAVRDDSWILVFDERHHAVETGEERLVYYNRARDFLQQPVLVQEQSSDGPPFVLALKVLGEPVSADTRTEVRVDASDCGVTATLDDESDCPIHDVSLSGFAAISRRTHHIGQALEVCIPYEGDEYVGEAEIMAATPLADHRKRYGFLGVFDTPQGRNLKDGLTRMTLEIQNRRLQRRSGAN